MDLDFFLTVGCLCALSRDFQLSIVFFFIFYFSKDEKHTYMLCFFCLIIFF